MKKKFAIYITLIVILTAGVFILSGCQNNEQPENNVENTTNTTNKTGESLRNQIMNAQNNVTENTVIETTTTNLEDLEKYNKTEAEGFKTYKDSEGLSFMIPANWLSVGTETEPAYMSAEGKGATVTVAKDKMSEDTTVVTDFDAYMGYQKLYLMQQMTMLSDIEEKQVNLNGKKAYILNYVAETKNESQEANKTPMNLNVTQLAFADEGNKVYILTMIVVDKYYNDFKDTFDTMIKSFMIE